MKKNQFKLGESRLDYWWTIKPLIGNYNCFFHYPTLWVLWFICLKFKTYNNDSKTFTKKLLYKIINLLHNKPEIVIKCILCGLKEMKIYLHFNSLFFIQELIQENKLFIPLKFEVRNLASKFIETLIDSYCKYDICYYDINISKIEKIQN